MSDVMMRAEAQRNADTARLARFAAAARRVVARYAIDDADRALLLATLGLDGEGS